MHFERDETAISSNPQKQSYYNYILLSVRIKTVLVYEDLNKSEHSPQFYRQVATERGLSVKFQHINRYRLGDCSKRIPILGNCSIPILIH